MNETTKRIISGLLLGFVYLFVIFYKEWYFLQLLILCPIVTIIGANEFYDLVDRNENGRPYKKLGIFFCVIIVILYFFQFLDIQNKVIPPDFFIKYRYFLVPGFVNGGSLLLLLMILLFIFSSILQILTRPLHGATYSIALTIFGFFYIALPIGHFILMLGLNNGYYYVMLVSTITIATDVAAYFGGRWLGRHPAGLTVSPNKTWEGYFSGILFPIVCVYVYNFIWTFLPFGEPMITGFEVFIISVLISLVSIIGDLVESSFKRDAKLKDSASVIPGHGGILDLGDAMLVSIPFLYYYVQLKGYLGFSI